jgi:hypothetical protein
MPAKSGPAEARPSIDDFELVRNGDGQWLLVLQDMPASLVADPTAPLRAELIDDDLILHQTSGGTLLRSLVAPQYAQGLRSDKPSELIICVVDDEGVRRLVRKIPVSL